MSIPICFDMDGVILEGPRTDPQIYADAADDALAELGADPTPTQRTDLRRHDLEQVRKHCGALGIDAARFWALKDEYASERTHARIRSGERDLYNDIDTIERLAERTRIGLVTNNRHATAAFVADYLPPEFDVVRGRRPTFEDYQHRKPNPRFLEDALSELGVEEGLYVGDSRKDVTAGQAAGLETAYLRRAHNRDSECPDEATAEIESLADLTTVLERISSKIDGESVQ